MSGRRGEWRVIAGKNHRRPVEKTGSTTRLCGTFGSSALPPDVNFFPLGLNYRGIPDFTYAVQTVSQYATMGGDTVWTAAEVLSVQ
jgi:hypothetical protein